MTTAIGWPTYRSTLSTTGVECCCWSPKIQRTGSSPGMSEASRSGPYTTAWALSAPSNPNQAAVGHRAADNGGMNHARQHDVVEVPARAAQEILVIAPSHSLADEPGLHRWRHISGVS